MLQQLLNFNPNFPSDPSFPLVCLFVCLFSEHRQGTQSSRTELSFYPVRSFFRFVLPASKSVTTLLSSRGLYFQPRFLLFLFFSLPPLFFKQLRRYYQNSFLFVEPLESFVFPRLFCSTVELVEKSRRVFRDRWIKFTSIGRASLRYVLSVTRFEC